MAFNIFGAGSEKGMEKKIIRIVADYTELSKNEITSDSRLQDDLGISSVDLLTCFKEIEDSMGVSFYDDFDMNQEKVETVGDIIRLAQTANGKE